jgi:hypothetical protein
MTNYVRDESIGRKNAVIGETVPIYNKCIGTDTEGIEKICKWRTGCTQTGYETGSKWSCRWRTFTT